MRTLLEREAVGAVREDYSDDGNAWNYFTHDQARSRALLHVWRYGSGTRRRGRWEFPWEINRAVTDKDNNPDSPGCPRRKPGNAPGRSIDARSAYPR